MTNRTLRPKLVTDYDIFLFHTTIFIIPYKQHTLEFRFYTKLAKQPAYELMVNTERDETWLFH